MFFSVSFLPNILVQPAISKGIYTTDNQPLKQRKAVSPTASNVPTRCLRVMDVVCGQPASVSPAGMGLVAGIRTRGSPWGEKMARHRL